MVIQCGHRSDLHIRSTEFDSPLNNSHHLIFFETFFLGDGAHDFFTLNTPLWLLNVVIGLPATAGLRSSILR